MTKEVTAQVVLESINKSLAASHCRPLAGTQTAVIAGVLAVWLEKAKAEGNENFRDIVRRAMKPLPEPEPRLMFGGGRSLRDRVKSANNN